jgi:S1-C subfamily serine protease
MRTVALVAAVTAAAVAAVALAAPDAGESTLPRALRVTSGNEIATGFAVAPGRVVTVAHVVDGAVTVRGRRARVVRVDRGSDLALLAVPGLGGAPAPALARAGGGERLRLVRLRDGRPSSRSVLVRRSIVAHVRGPGSAGGARRAALELAASVRAGDSGAPVVTREGAVAGVVFAASRDRPHTAYAVDASALGRLLGVVRLRR